MGKNLAITSQVIGGPKQESLRPNTGAASSYMSNHQPVREFLHTHHRKDEETAHHLRPPSMGEDKRWNWLWAWTRAEPNSLKAATTTTPGAGCGGMERLWFARVPMESMRTGLRPARILSTGPLLAPAYGLPTPLPHPRPSAGKRFAFPTPLPFGLISISIT